ncbi:MAG: methyl-accepting chemotaxis protein [Lachnospiraceae bacterium]|jgi:methyl-accepting chemotaxis protein|nr:methyl-accepting chemotaxis protein [Lachnospiraceae bacterium]
MRSIRFIFISITISIITVFMVILSYFNYQYSKSIILDNIENKVIDVATLGASELNSWLALRIVEVETIANTPILKENNQNNINEYLGSQLEQLNSYSSFWVSDLNGDWYSPLGTSGSIKERDYFPKVISTKQTVISNPLIGKADGKLAIVVAVPIIRDGTMIGILGANVKAQELIQQVNAIQIGETGYANLFQYDGTVIAHKDESLILNYNPFQDSTSPLQSIQNDILNQEVGLHEMIVDGQSLYISHAKLELTDWVVVTHVYVSEFMGSLTAFFRTTIFSSIILLLVASIIVWFFTMRMTRPIKKLQNIAELMAKGDCTATVNIKDKTEIGNLASSFSMMGKNFNLLLKNIYSSASQVAAFSEELTATAISTAERANEVSDVINDVAEEFRVQLDSVEKMTNAVTQISSSISQVDDNIKDVSISADKTVEAAKNGNKAVSSVIYQMDQIKEVVSNAAKVIAEVGIRSQKINEIVDTISNISEQTNLLSLNASIEAARAGEQGRGFAVVAQEVGKLAEQSNEATKKIALLVFEMQESTKKAISSINEGTHEVTIGANVVNDADTAFKDIQNLINQLLMQLQQITKDVHSIGSENDELVYAVEEINNVSKSIGPQTKIVEDATKLQLLSIKEIEKSMHELSKMGEKLIEEVGHFKVE